MVHNSANLPFLEQELAMRRAQLLANRSQVNLKLGREDDAQADAQAACESAAGWPKAYHTH